MAILTGVGGENKTRKQPSDASMPEISVILGAVLPAYQPPDAAYAEPKVTARLATATADRLAAFRLRYEVYIAEQGKPYPEKPP